MLLSLAGGYQRENNTSFVSQPERKKTQYQSNAIQCDDVTGSQAPHMATVNHNYCLSVPTTAQCNTEAFSSPASNVSRQYRIVEDGNVHMENYAKLGE